MALCCGMIGLPNVGKTTVFNALTAAGALAANYPFATVDPNTGIALVPDPRLRTLTDIFKSKKTTYSTLEVRDIAGLVEGASKGEGLGNQFLGHIREVDALLHVVRCFQGSDVVHVSGSVNPLTFNMDPAAVEAAITPRHASARSTSAVTRACTKKSLRWELGGAKTTPFAQFRLVGISASLKPNSCWRILKHWIAGNRKPRKRSAPEIKKRPLKSNSSRG